MKVLVFTSHFPEKAAPTRATYNLNTFRELAKLVDLEIVCPKPWWGYLNQEQSIPRIYTEDVYGIHASYITYWSVPGLSFLHGAAMVASLYSYMRQYLKKHAFDIILATWAYPDSMAAAFFAGLADCPLVTVVLGSDINELTNRKLLKPQIKWTLGKSTRIVSVSHAMADKIASLGIDPDKITVQHNGVDGNLFSIRDKHKARTMLGLPSHEKLIVFVGNLSPEKGIDTLIKAVSNLVKEESRKHIRCAVIGDGVMKSELLSISQQLGLADNMIFTGRLLPQEISIWLNACDVFCLPSNREGCPNVILEALASGCPVVASKVGGIPELLNKENGLLAQPKNDKQLSICLNTALEKEWNPDSLRRSVEYLSWESIGLTYKKMFEEIQELSTEA
ncbi:MAG: glycosyltransferase family 4 protein [Desulfobacteraceae bacterium]|nr:MAG: glycosyltransferase family 4 protein [Desulfobacteraceae bacterium]